MGFLSNVFDSHENALNLFDERPSESYVDPAQGPFLQFLREQAQGQYEQSGGAQAQAGFGLAENLTGQGQGFLNTLGAGANQRVADSQIESLTDILNRNLSMNLGTIGGNASVGNTYGGGRQGVMEGTAIGDTQLALASGVSDIYANQNQNNLMGATVGLGALQGQFGLGMSGFTNAQQPLANFANLIGQPTVLSTGGTGSIAQQGGSAAGGIMGGLTSMSDSRLKRDIELIGNDGQRNWYSYRYIWDNVKRVGVMAQELLETEPENVIITPSGYLAVNYGGLV